MQHIQINVHCPKAIPPTYMISNKQNRQLFFFQLTNNPYNAKMPFNNKTGVPLKKGIYNEIMFRF